jgi:predicted dehydrogenase
VEEWKNMRRIGFGFVGTGVIGRRHLESAAATGVLRDFATAVLNNRSPKTTLEQALLVQQITDAIYLSAKSKHCEDI